MTALWSEIRYGLRMLRRAPGFTAAVVAILTIGIGANFAIFSLLYAVTLQKLPVGRPDELVVLRWKASRPLPKDVLEYSWGGDKHDLFSFPTYRLLARRNRVFSGFFGFAQIGMTPGGVTARVGGHALYVQGEVVTGGYFAGLGAEPAVGRLIGPGDERAGAPPAVVISYTFWTREFGRSRSALGETMTLNGLPYTIVGVTQPPFFGAQPGWVPDFWEPVDKWEGMQNTMANMQRNGHRSTNWWLTLMGRLKPGITQPRARSQLNVLFQRSLTSGPPVPPRPQDLPSIELVPASRGLGFLSQEFSPTLVILMAIVGLGLILSCANVATLMLARASARSREVAVRIALGAPRARVLRQVFIESLLLAGVGGALGLVFAYWAGRTLIAILSGPVHSLGMALPAAGTGAVLIGFGAAVFLLVGLVCGIAPASLQIRVQPASALKGAEDVIRAGRGGRRIGAGGFLVAAQVAISLLVVIGAGLFIRTLDNLEHINLGFEPRHLELFTVNPAKDGYRGAALAQFYDRLLDRVRSLPGVSSASSSVFRPISPFGAAVPVTIEDAGGPAGGLWVEYNPVGPRFFRTMGIRILQGRGLKSTDTRNTRKVAVVNRTLARRFFNRTGAVGHLFNFGASPDPHLAFEIVGVADDVKYNNVREIPSPMVYVPYSQFPLLLDLTPVGMHYELRINSAPGSLLTAVQSIVRHLDPNLPVSTVKTQMEEIDQSLARQRVLAQLGFLLGLFTLLLAGTGIYAVQSFTVSRRTREIGIRMALGAGRRQILFAIWRQSLVLGTIGVGVGLVIAIRATRVIASQLYGVRDLDPTTIAVAAAVLIATALLGGYIPARRATRVDPAEALRFE